MKERKIGTIEMPYINRDEGNTRRLRVEGYNSKDTRLSLHITLPRDRVARLDYLACAILGLKRMFTDIKNEIETQVDGVEERARSW
jgi:hypothetical protein